MAKKSGAFILIVLYLFTAMGFSPNLKHGGSKVTLTKTSANKSCGVVIVSKVKCCRNKHPEVKDKEPHESGLRSFFKRRFIFEPAKMSFESFFLAVQTVPGKFFYAASAGLPSNNLILILSSNTFLQAIVMVRQTGWC